VQHIEIVEKTTKVLPIDKLIPYANNARSHSKEQITQIAASIKEFGFNNPILLDGNNGIIAGHGRLLAAQQLGLETVPVLELSHLSETQKKAYILADNQIALNANWDLDILRFEMEDLQATDLNVDLIGFDDEFLTLINLDIEQGDIDFNAEWEGMPEFDQEDQLSFRNIIIHFDNNEDIKEFAKLLGQIITDKTKSMWYPAKNKNNTKDYNYS
jgi:hypothetical protein